MIYHLRPFQPADMLGLAMSCWPERSSQELDKLQLQIQSLRDHNRGEAIVCLSPSCEPVGFGLLTLWPTRAEISDLIVSRHLRNNGIGTSMIKALCTLAESYQSLIVEIGVMQDNHAALRLYERLGFIKYKIVQLGGNHTGRVIYLEKHLIRQPRHNP